MIPNEGFHKKVVAGEDAIQAIFPVLTQSILSRIPPLPLQAIILDIGGGSGLWLEAFRAAGYKRGVLVEPRHDYASFAADRWRKLQVPAMEDQNSLPGYFPVVTTAEALPFPPGTVQLVISRNSLHLWHNIPLGISNVARVLQNGGFAFIGRGFGPDLSEDLREKVKEKRKAFHSQYYPEEKEEPQSPEPDEIRSLMMKSGFRTATLIPDRKSWWILAGK